MLEVPVLEVPYRRYGVPKLAHILCTYRSILRYGTYGTYNIPPTEQSMLHFMLVHFAVVLAPGKLAFHNEVIRWLAKEQLYWRDLSDDSFILRHTDRPVLLVGPKADEPMLALHLLHTPRHESDVLPAYTTSYFADSWEDARKAEVDGDEHQSSYHSILMCRKPLPLVHLWEDEWSCRSEVVYSRLLAMNGRSRRHFARNLEVLFGRAHGLCVSGFMLTHPHALTLTGSKDRRRNSRGIPS